MWLRSTLLVWHNSYKSFRTTLSCNYNSRPTWAQITSIIFFFFNSTFLFLYYNNTFRDPTCLYLVFLFIFLKKNCTNYAKSLSHMNKLELFFFIFYYLFFQYGGYVLWNLCLSSLFSMILFPCCSQVSSLSISKLQIACEIPVTAWSCYIFFVHYMVVWLDYCHPRISLKGQALVSLSFLSFLCALHYFLLFPNRKIYLIIIIPHFIK